MLKAFIRGVDRLTVWFQTAPTLDASDRSAEVDVKKFTMRHVVILLGYHSELIRSTKSYRINDFIEYWASARLLLTGNNPYSLSELSSLQKSVGWNHDKPLIMWNPP